MFSYSIVTLLCVASATMVSAFNETDHHWLDFQKFVTRFDKSYSNLVELEKRFETFKENMEFIRLENGKDHSYQLGVTHFADLTEDEFSRFFKQDGPPPPPPALSKNITK